MPRPSSAGSAGPTPATSPTASARASRTLQTELHKKHPFDLPEEETFLSILRTNSLLSNQAERFLRGFDLSIATYNVLRILRGSMGQGRTCSQIGGDMVARVPDVTRLIDRLEQRGLAQRERADADRRVVRVHLTSDGLALLKKIDKSLPDFHRAQLGHLSKHEHDTLHKLLAKVRDALEPGGE